MTAAALAGKKLTGAEVALGIAYFAQCGPDEATGTAAEFLTGIGGDASAINQQTLDKLVAARKAGLAPERMNLEAIIRDLMGWDAVRIAVALAEAQANGWLTRVGKGEPN